MKAGSTFSQHLTVVYGIFTQWNLSCADIHFLAVLHLFHCTRKMQTCLLTIFYYLVHLSIQIRFRDTFWDRSKYCVSNCNLVCTKMTGQQHLLYNMVTKRNVWNLNGLNGLQKNDVCLSHPNRCPLTTFVNIGDSSGSFTSTESEFESLDIFFVLTINIQSARIANV